MDSQPSRSFPSENLQETNSQPASLNYRILALLWLVISLPAVFLLVRDRAWLQAPPGLDRLRALKLEQGLAAILILIQLYLMFRAQLEWAVQTANESDLEEAKKQQLGHNGKN